MARSGRSELSSAAGWLAAALAAVAAAVARVRGWLRARRMILRFPCKPPLPLVGHLFDCGVFAPVAALIDYFISECLRLRAGRAQLGPFAHIFIADPRDVQVFVSNAKNQDKTFLYTFTAEAIGEGLVSISGEKWKRHHKIIAPAFYGDVLESFVSVFNRQGDAFVESLREHADGNAFDAVPLLEHAAFAIICETAMGIRMRSESDRDRQYYKALELVTRELMERIQRPWLYPQCVYRLSARGRQAAGAHRLLRRVQCEGIRARRAMVEELGDPCTAAPAPAANNDNNEQPERSSRRRRLAFVDLLLRQQKNGARISDEEIAEELDTLMFTGFDTVKLSVGFSLYALAHNPDIQEKIIQELEKIFDFTQPLDITPESLRNLTYLEQVIKETLRLHPPVWFFARKCGVDVPLVSCNLEIPAGSSVIIPIKAIHLDPGLYPHPEVFDPERFSPENSANRHPYGFLPFGSGQRICIGRRYAMLEAKTILAKLLWHYEVRPDPSYEPKYTWGITSPPTNGLWIKLCERNR